MNRSQSFRTPTPSYSILQPQLEDGNISEKHLDIPGQNANATGHSYVDNAVGALVGSVEGDADGAPVGTAMSGIPIGATVGLCVTGDSVGVFVTGAIVGNVVGSIDGEAVGHSC